jgi:hypothetical protein
MRDKLLKECWIIYDNCRFTAEAHHQAASISSCFSKIAQAIPAAVAAIATGVFAAGNKPEWWLYIAAFSATISAVSGALDPMKSYYQHFSAAKQFTILKHDARGLRETFSETMDDQCLQKEVRALHEKYKMLAGLAPQTGRVAFWLAQRVIKSGTHDNEEMPNT